jgi:hypothetical protein
METFNYIAVMISIILGLGLNQLLAGIGSLVQVRQRVRLYWLHALWVLIIIMGHADMWWSLWAVRASVAWTFPKFVYLLTGPALLVIASHIIMPSEFYEEIHRTRIDLDVHFFNVRRLFFSVMSVLSVWTVFLEPALGVRSLFVKFRLIQVAALAAFVSCAVSKNRVLQAVAAFVILIIFTIVTYLFRFRVGSFDFN